MPDTTALDPRRIISELGDDERDALLSLVGEGERATVMMDTADRLQQRGLATVMPDGHMDVSDLGRDVIRTLRDE